MTDAEKALIRAYINLFNSRVETLNNLGGVVGVCLYDNDSPLYEEPVMALYDIVMKHFVVLSEEEQCRFLNNLSDYGSDKPINADEVIAFIEERM